ncbi:MAG: leucyl/phenylalanyl-tRNA--protein transferase [Deltaproteobacteria bacterium]|nr:leucyl/phenylalanyl-tRNA--protein transferase [Deltaproteobacteria bacterium]
MIIDEPVAFPSPRFAGKDGLLAIGGGLSEKRLLLAYRMGIFPWFSDDQPILWWSPDPRLVLYPDEIRISKSLQKVIKKKIFHLTMDTAFEQVINACAQVPRADEQGTWIVKDMIDAYCRLHESGFAHSVEAWYKGKLVGGLYGISLGKSFFGESMFTYMSNASKVVFAALVDYLRKISFDMIDCQIATAHLIRFGAIEISRDRFLDELKQSLDAPTRRGKWSFF